MGRSGHRSRHALLPTLKGEPGDPFLPDVRELYLISTAVFTFGFTDPAADRRAVVITRPVTAGSNGVIQVVTRTSDVRAPGVRHPADLSLRCEKDGVFSDLGSVEQQLWTPENVERLGVLPEPFWAAIEGRFL
jgi:hypothetical protein